jgi:hypothetical protein
MQLVEIRVEWNHAVTPEVEAALREFAVGDLPEFEDQKDYADPTLTVRRVKYGSGKAIVAVTALSHFAGWQVVRLIDNASTRALHEYGQRTNTVINERCNVAVSGLGLLTISEVMVERDFCTEALQQKLTEGWRIVAVCVQPDQRRPDYILGRSANGTPA